MPVSCFHADPEKCTACGACVKDCPTEIIEIRDNIAVVVPERNAECIGCQHCLAICPVAAASVEGRLPEDSRPVAPFDPVGLDNLIRSRRTVRKFAPGTVDRDLLQRVLETVMYAPTGCNARNLRYTIVYEKTKMDAVREATCRAMVDYAERNPDTSDWILMDYARKWLNGGQDRIFRGAPHLLVVTAGPEQVCKAADCLIALSYFDLYATANGIGTVWCGAFDGVMRMIPESRRWLDIPEDHELGYAMLFGPNGTHYPRTIQRDIGDVVLL